MRRSLHYVCIATTVFLILACAPAAEPEPAAAPAADSAPAADASADPVAGTWSGDWGPSANDRNTVTVELRWEGATLIGTVNPGPNAVQLTQAFFNTDTKAIMMTADAPGRGGVIVHYTIDGIVAGNMMSGSWSHDNVNGDFTLTKN